MSSSRQRRLSEKEKAAPNKFALTLYLCIFSAFEIMLWLTGSPNSFCATEEIRSFALLKQEVELAVSDKDEKSFRHLASKMLEQCRQQPTAFAKMAEALECAGRGYLAFGLAKESVTCFTEALQIRKSARSPKCSESIIINTLCNLATAELNSGRFPQAEFHAQEALNAARLSTEDSANRTAKALEILVMAENAQERFVELQFSARELISIKKRQGELGQASSAVLALVRSLLASNKREDALEALQFLCLPQAGDKATLRAAADFISLAQIRATLEQYDQVHMALVEAFNIASKAPPSPAGWRCWNQLAGAFIWPGVDNEMAAVCYRKAIEALKYSESDDNVRLDLLLRLHRLYASVGKDEGSLRLLEQEIESVHASVNALKKHSIEVGASNLHLRLAEDRAENCETVDIDKWLYEHQNRFPGEAGKALQLRIKADWLASHFEFRQSIQLYKSALSILQKLHGASRQLADCTRRLAEAYLNAGQIKDGLVFAQSALAAAESMKNPHLADEGYRLLVARALINSGKPEDALEYLIKDCTEYENRRPQSPLLVSALRERAALYLRLGDTQSALKDMNEVFRIVLKKGMPESPDYQLLARIHSYMHRFPVAKQYLSKALESSEGLLKLSDSGKRLSSVKKAILCLQIAEIQYDLSQFSQAEINFQKCISLSDGIPELNRSQLPITARQCMADNSEHLRPGDKLTPITLTKTALELAEKNFGHSSSFYLNSIPNYAQKMLRASNDNTATTFYAEYLQKAQAYYGNDTIVIDNFQQAADAMTVTGKFDLAAQYYSKAAEMAKDNKIRQASRQADALTGLGQLKLMRKEYAAADFDLSRSLVIRRSLYPVGDPALISNLKALVYCAEQLHHPQVASYTRQLNYQLAHRPIEIPLPSTYINLPWQTGDISRTDKH